MNTTNDRILGTIAAEDFVGREIPLGRLTAHAAREMPAGLALIAAPGSGSSELVRQTYDSLFREHGEVIPFYFAIRSSDYGPREAAQRFLQDLLTQTIAFRLNDPSIIDSSPDLDELSEMSAAADDHWIDPLIRSARSDDGEDHRSYIRSLLSAPLRASTHGVRFFVMIDDIESCASMPGGDELFSELRDIYSRSDIAFLFAGWLACASSAQASCAYYVVPAHPSSEMSVSRQTMKDSHSQDIPCPCKGQECRANHSQGAVPAVPQVTSDNEMALSAVDGTEWLPSGDLSLIQDLSSPSEAYLLLPDPPPKTHVHSN